MNGPEKRRTIWVNDREWAGIQARAENRAMTPSGYLRFRASMDDLHPLGPSSPHPAAPDRDGLPDSPALSGAGSAGTAKPFLAYNPAPKIRAKR